MKNTLWHFGDSYTNCWHTEQVFSHHIANKINFNLEHHGKNGLSNLGIFSKIVSQTHKFKSGDVVLVNWSFFDRVESVIRKGNELEMINNADIRFFQTNDVNQGVLDGSLGHALWLLNGINFSHYESHKLFFVIRNYFDSLFKMGIKAYHVYISNKENVLGEFAKPELEFEGGYWSWLHSNNYHNEESEHYTYGIQEKLAKEYIGRMMDCGLEVEIKRNIF
jgi:hypothetical protein